MGLFSTITSKIPLVNKLPIGDGKLRQALGMKPKGEGIFSQLGNPLEKMADATGWLAKAKFWLIAGGITLLVLIVRPWEWLIPRRRSR